MLEAVETYSANLLAGIDGIDPSLPADAKLGRYTQLFGKVLGDGRRICLCGMLAADIEALPDSVRQAVQAFFGINERWLAALLAQGAEDGTLAFSGAPEDAARTLYAAYQGAVLASRLFQSKARLDEVERAWKKAP
ncbi:Transcriptional regulator AcuR [Burkholderia glumae]|nr:Transcriptional regulator AcuR [Burkholderia glumae]